MQTTETSLQIRLFSVQEYHRMAEAGILHPKERVELIAGQIIKKMSPQGTAHAIAVVRTDRLLQNRLGEQVVVRTQLPIQLNDRSEPEPDIALVKLETLDNADRHPTPEEVYLIIEVADTTLKSDCGIKATNYAESGIADYWVLDVINRELHVFREPTQNGYESEVILLENDSVSPLAFLTCTLVVREMLRKVVI